MYSLSETMSPVLGVIAGGKERAAKAAQGPWARPMGRAALVLTAVVFLSWLGARSAESMKPPSEEPDLQMGALVTMAATVSSNTQEPFELDQGFDDRDAGAAEPAEPANADAVTDAGAVERAPGVLPDGRVVLNTATVEELCRLPGIGPSRAAKVVELRSRLGKFRSVRQLLRVRGIGPRMLKRITPLVVLDPPAPEPNPAMPSDGAKDGG